MRRLILFRHSKAERSQPGEEDAARPLMEHGRRDAARIGAYMATHGLIPERVLISPAQRTQETWKHIAGALRSTPLATTVHRLYNASAQVILAVIKDTPASARSLLVLGHNPGLHELALMLVASGDVEVRERLAEKLPTSGLVVVDFPVDAWSELHAHSGRLERFITPQSLSAGDVQ